MILVFDMVFSLWASLDADDFSNSGYLILFPFGAEIARNFPAASASNGWHAGLKMDWEVTDCEC
jgi:hypothetical protein